VKRVVLFPCCDALKACVKYCRCSHELRMLNLQHLPGTNRPVTAREIGIRSCLWSVARSRLVIWSHPTCLIIIHPCSGSSNKEEKRGSSIAVRFDSSRIASYRMSTQSPTPNPYAQPSFFPTHALVRAPCMSTTQLNSLSYLSGLQDHAFAGIGAGTVAVLCMNPLDLLKVKFQVSTRAPGSGIGRGIWLALRDIQASEGWRGLYRGLGPNVAGNASSWGLYFLLCVLHFIPFGFLFLHFFPSLIAIINSSVGRRSEHPIDPSLPHSIFSIPPKRVRISSMLLILLYSC
jgi:hypothetical protein